MAGKLIVLEGTDGSGKSTQFARLKQRLEGLGVAFRCLKFPQYEEESSALIRMYLGGEFGSHPSDVNGYAASAFYAVDRYASYKKVWGEWYEQGGLVLADRYTTSNAIHQASKVPPEEREDFFRWLYDFEYNKLGLPEPDRVLYLDVPTDATVQLMRKREASTHTTADIHEQDTAYLRTCRESADQAARVLGWYRVQCVRDGAMRSIEEIHQEIWQQVEPLL
jgi:dTMP kinase